jgi:hypothetical protein
LIAVSELGGIVPCDLLSWKKTIPNIIVTKLIAKICRRFQIELVICHRDTYIVWICEETNTSYNAGSDVVPTKRSLVDFSKSESSSLVGVLNMGEVIVEVVESGISTSGGSLRSGSHLREENILVTGQMINVSATRYLEV